MGARRNVWLLILYSLIATALPAADLNDELLTACRKGDLASAQQLLAKGADMETKTPYGQTPLYLAAINGHEDVVRFLLDKGADAEVTDTFYKVPMSMFAIAGK